MNRINIAPKLISQRLHDKFGFVAIEPTAMHQHARWFVDGHAILVLVQNLQHGQLSVGERDIVDGKSARARQTCYDGVLSAARSGNS
mgnify:CR=1 FL=1